MSKHTHGPWVVRRFPTARGGLDCWWVLDSLPDENGQVVANAICTLTMSNDDAEANARLIAAAPYLLEACKAMQGELLMSQYAKLGDFSVALKLAEAAIAKAEGGE